MTDYLIVIPEQLPYWVMSAWLAFSILGYIIGHEIEQHHKYKEY